jgi:DNA-binding transcriptional MocR family regulator
MTNDTSTDVLAQRLRSELAGRAPGERLASTRQLVETHRVSPVTVSRALSTLAAEGLLVTRPGMGTFVAEPPAASEPVDFSWQTAALADGALDTRGIAPLSEPAGDGTISLAMGYLHGSLMPVKLLSAALARASRLPNVWTSPPAGGLAGLRTWFAQQAAPGLDARDVTITSGGQAALSAVLRSLVRAGQPLLVESPTYPGAIAVARAAGIRLVPVPIDEHGVIPELLDDLLRRTGAKAFYTQPAFQNPTGTSLVAERRAEVLAVAADAGAFVVEDDFAHWLSHDGHPPRALLADDRDGRVVYIASLTKVASPALRVGAVIARGPIAERVRSLRIVDDMFVHRPIQEAALELVSRPGWQRHVGGLGQTLERRSRALARAIAEHLPACTLSSRPPGGMHLWVRLPDRSDDTAIAVAAERHGVIVMRGSLFHPAEAPAPYLRITFSATPTEAELDTGIRRLAVAAPELAGGS